MNKKQAGIILALLALIVCAGVMATKVNGNIDELAIGNLDTGKNTLSLGKEKKEKEVAQSDYFYESRTIRDQRTSETVQTLKTLMSEKDISTEEKDSISKKHTDLALNQDNENRIEIALKGKGFEDVLCLIEGDKARIIVKTKEELTEKQRKQIQEVVMSVSKIKNVEIDTKQ
ncbi:SpoIIIAH-like family protein [Clostridium algidicarnis]|uniref:SpoIIIAH-like family protein n=1 Tax=Clostridium algidicarnis TaxID=37659 RepID=UPI001C0CDF71|nr:SpoIIIAH-like family protein [Clostridium algidicarnis]MBU3195461.1 SpoIIIAH-like family protein [Clostridium algidicarnis]MBU3208421.1 SpoIIIAH-like family protein [Clostridium algidicarnis]MBU3226983.1 SpoIIIAH-like family protein [Clostridium algidicarnis]MBU3250106.1 SpoIIIAH-like family protein [Clostridium algidicarnis]